MSTSAATPVPPHVRLVNDIAAQFHHLPAEQGVAKVLAHLRMFWDPRMRAQLIDTIGGADQADLDPLAAAAAARLRTG